MEKLTDFQFIGPNEHYPGLNNSIKSGSLIIYIDTKSYTYPTYTFQFPNWIENEINDGRYLLDDLAGAIVQHILFGDQRDPIGYQ
ncbi:MAG: hypothetical protein BGO59_22655 [Spirosoma sp. 48-14]|nr:MAG: hypothetical protein BGO59_22655 [Spirosoma sp. 48-14]